MAAVVAPVGIQDPQFSLVGVPAFFGEIPDDFIKVVLVHGEAHPFAEILQFSAFHVPESRKHRYWLHGSILGIRKLAEILDPGFDGVDDIMADLVQNLFSRIFVHDQEFGTLDVDLRFRIDQVDTVHSRCRPLVELPGKIFHSDVFCAFKVEAVGHEVGDHFTEYAVAALLQELGGEAEKIVNVKQPERTELQLQILVKFSEEAFGFHLELGIFFNENAVVVHLFVKNGCPRSLMTVPVRRTLSGPGLWNNYASLSGRSCMYPPDCPA